MENLSTEELRKILIEELKIIQDIIKRMASNSFLIKGWTITLIVAAILFSEGSKDQIIIAWIPLLLFWYLDSYFLRQERLYRKLYVNLVSKRQKSSENLFSLDIKSFESEVGSVLKTMISKTLLIFYGLLALVLFILYFFGKNNFDLKQFG